MAITKEKFFEILDYLQEINNFENDFRKLLYTSKKDSDFLDAAMFTDCRLVDYIIYLLQNEFEDVEGWIPYWIYELDFGRSWYRGMIIESEWRDIKLQTKEDLYDFLIDNLIIKYKRGTD